MPIGPSDSLDIISVAAGYAQQIFTPRQVIAEISRRIHDYADPAVWIHLLSKADLETQFNRLESLQGKLPLYGIPFAVKDNIDVAGHPTTAGCPAFSYVPSQTATAVQKLLEAGAILIGKTNLDQFATGLVGVRSPYGACRNPFNPEYISGGSSSGSAVAVAGGLVSFALGTDTAGSGRVPAAFNNIIGYKPTRGLISAAGVVPACKSLDCISIFALTCSDAAVVADVISGFDATDPFSRNGDEIPSADLPTEALRFGVPSTDRLEFFGNREFQRIYVQTIGRMEGLGFQKVEIDFDPFARAGELLYQGPWVAERVAGLREFLSGHSDDLLPVTREIFATADRFTAVDAFAAAYQLASLRQQTRSQWNRIDLLLLPTTGTIYTRSEIESNPVQLNRNLGYYTQFANLLDLCGVAVPSGLTQDNLPFGVTLIAPAGQDRPLLQVADRLHRAVCKKLGATANPLPSSPKIESAQAGVRLAVVGAHLTGQPLNYQLTQRHGRLIGAAKTAGCYRLYALANTTPAKPGLARVIASEGLSIEVEVWELSAEAFGTFVAAIPAPMVIGTIQLDDGSSVKGFLCEPLALKDAQDITHFRGWRAYLKSV